MYGMYRDPDAAIRALVVFAALAVLVVAGGLLLVLLPFGLGLLGMCAAATCGALLFFKLFE